MIVKKKLLQASLFPGYIEKYCYYASQSNGCVLLKEGIQRLMDDRVILFEKTPYKENLCKIISQSLKLEDVSMITISGTPVRITSRVLCRLMSNLWFLL